ncbi:hypothetical protein A2U01_0044460, partial [Trifolium medium]|nr:hypothetical protein [Trifolium medium]
RVLKGYRPEFWATSCLPTVNMEYIRITNHDEDFVRQPWP